ncbi:MAG: helicase-exonuclease AddAB subunit AddA [Lachnospiraceae bacterium]|nr:helicase-exonuclease AddAB subunit AddA [Lachnospiraceae bacterium]
MNPTPEQQSVIDAPIGNLLVSAAAGSGKTSVLVRRIMEMITRETDPVEIDEILIVTFTRNAAAEMRNRIEVAIEKKLEENPDDVRLQRQSRNIHFAKISTIDSFCQYVVRRFFHYIDIDPGFRLLDQSESELMRERVLDDVLEKAYAAETPEFSELAEMYGGKLGDNGLREIITKIISACESSPFPAEWLDLNCRRFSDAKNTAENPYTEEIFKDCRNRLIDAREAAEALYSILGEPGMPACYVDAVNSDLDILQQLCSASDIGELTALTSVKIAWKRAVPKKGEKEATDEGKKALCEKIRDSYKKTVNEDVAARIRNCSADLYEKQEQCETSLTCLCDLAKRFIELLEKQQRDKNAYDFSTIAHMALRILLGEDHKPTEAAKQLSGEFREIMIDEYQDSNQLQECILGAVTSNNSAGVPNLFMVGDVKQSIYKFRQAKPELFLDKCDRFVEDPSVGTRIDLQRNFRSRREVVEAVNEVFERLMTRGVGGVEYDDRAALQYGGVYDDRGGNPDDYRSELLLTNYENNTVADEADLILARIRELTDQQTGLQICDANGELRTAELRDIVILTRSKSELVQTLQRRMQEASIPYYAASTDGYFDSAEVSAVVSMLRVLDNPFQEIPLAEVLMSPAVGFTVDDMALLAIRGRKSSESRRSEYTQTVIRKLCMEETTEERFRALRKKCEQWLTLYDDLKRHAVFVNTSEIIEEFLNRTGFFEYCCALPDAEVRRKNLRMLVLKAEKFRESFTGNICDFVEYIDNTKKYNAAIVDNIGGGSPNAVCMMTIHGSKGMEFPIVFLADISKDFNMKDLDGNFLIHDELGFGPTVVFPKEKMKFSTPAREAVKSRIHRDLVGEEMRLLYVALTRAKEKLIVTGRLDSESVIGMLGKAFRVCRRVCYADFMNARTGFGPLLTEAIACRCSSEQMQELCREAVQYPDDFRMEIGAWSLRILKSSGNAESGKEDASVGTVAANCGLGVDISKGYAGVREEELRREYVRELQEYRDFRYQSEGDDVPVKVAVSDLKKQAYLEKEAEEELRDRADGVVRVNAGRHLEAPRESEPMPSFADVTAEKDSATAGTEFGTICHRVMQLYDLGQPATEEAFCAEIAAMCARKQLSEDEAARIRPEMFLHFFRSELGERMRQAYRSGRLERERAFILSRPADELGLGFDSKSPVLIQGVIDAFFEEDDGCVVVDYKTDALRGEGAEKEFLRRYERQLELYANAVERGTGRHVKESIIYSFSLNKSIVIGYNEKR